MDPTTDSTEPTERAQPEDGDDEVGWLVHVGNEARDGRSRPGSTRDAEEEGRHDGSATARVGGSSVRREGLPGFVLPRHGVTTLEPSHGPGGQVTPWRAERDRQSRHARKVDGRDGPIVAGRR
jgi:hypothetical protein